MTAPLHQKTAARVLEELRRQLQPGIHRFPQLRAVTLHQPWAWAILYGGKTVENRVWRLSRLFCGKWIALHAAVPQKNEVELGKWLRTAAGLAVPPPEKIGRGIVGLVKFGTPFQVDPDGFAGRKPQNVWEVGPWCWPIEDRVAIPEPIPLKGMQGFWFVAQDPKEQLLGQLERAALPGAANG